MNNVVKLPTAYTPQTSLTRPDVLALVGGYVTRRDKAYEVLAVKEGEVCLWECGYGRMAVVDLGIFMDNFKDMKE